MNGVTDNAIRASCQSRLTMTIMMPTKVRIAVINGTKPSVDRDRNEVASFWIR